MIGRQDQEAMVVVTCQGLQSAALAPCMCPITVETFGITGRLIERAHEFVIGQSGLQLMLEQREVVQLHTLMASLMELFKLYCAISLWDSGGCRGIAYCCWCCCR
jgi:hypothetical protein